MTNLSANIMLIEVMFKLFKGNLAQTTKINSLSESFSTD